MKRINYFIKKYLENRPMFMSIIRSQEAMLFQKYGKFIKGKVMDFGCGEGFFAELVFGKRKINIGLDLFNNIRVEEARSKNIYKKILLYDGNRIPFEDKYFKSIVSNCVLEHIPKIQFSLKEIYRILQPGGFFVTSVMADRWETNQFGGKIFGKRYQNFMRKIQAHHNLFSNQKWQTYFKKAGFKIESVEGYLYPKSSYWLDISHYLSIFSLISYKLFGIWMLMSIPIITEIKTRMIKSVIIDEKNLDKASALFFVLKK